MKRVPAKVARVLELYSLSEIIFNLDVKEMNYIFGSLKYYLKSEGFDENNEERDLFIAKLKINGFEIDD